MDNNHNRQSNNFDLIRLLAASFVLIGHASAILINKMPEYDPVLWLFNKQINYFGVLVFFVISGYLVTKSWELRMNVLDFLTARVLRIFPALICLILLCVFVLGPLVTSSSMSDYFSSGLTLDYLKNITLYRMYYYLPGVFEHNPLGSSVNGSLWTLPFEFTCYLVLIILGIASALRYKWLMLCLHVIFIIVYLLFDTRLNTVVIPILGIDFANFLPLFIYFMSGCIFYKFRESIRYNVIGLLICAVALFLIRLGYLPDLLLCYVLSYLVLMFAFSKKIKLGVISKYGDFSYGLYLYAFPVQQLIVYLLPIHSVLLMIVLSLAFTIPFALLSWFYIEKPALHLREIIYRKFTKGLRN